MHVGSAGICHHRATRGASSIASGSLLVGRRGPVGHLGALIGASQTWLGRLFDDSGCQNVRGPNSSDLRGDRIICQLGQSNHESASQVL